MHLGFGGNKKLHLIIQDKFSAIQHKKLVVVVWGVVFIFLSFPAKYQENINKGNIMWKVVLFNERMQMLTHENLFSQ